MMSEKRSQYCLLGEDARQMGLPNAIIVRATEADDDRKRAFLKTDCNAFGILRAIDIGDDEAPRLMRIIIGQPPRPSAPAVESVVYSLHVWPNYDLAQVRAWIDSWPHVGASFERAINEVIDGYH